MYTLGIWGGVGIGPEGGHGGHDACAVLLKDGAVAAAVEEERLCRVKHTRREPRMAVASCLEHAGITADDVDLFAVGMKRRTHSAAALSSIVGRRVPESKMVFLEHHLAHAYSAFAVSDIDDALVVSFDGLGDSLAGVVARGVNGRIERLREIWIRDSLGMFYVRVIDALGYRLFDEYKVMGLAPYGDPSRFRCDFAELFALRSEGRYRLFPTRVGSVLARIGERHRSGEPFNQTHLDIAAALQETLEQIALHVLGWFTAETGLRNLCLAGGVAHNCSMNGAIAVSGLFDRIFVPPAAHDAGTALGAAAWAYTQQSQQPVRPITHAYWGTAAPTGEALERELAAWADAVEVRRVDNVEQEAARLLASGTVLGWVQGRSEFGPRALGNRSILADPRPPENKTRINAMVKKRESYRPFAPSVPSERAAEFFDIPPAIPDCGFMVFVVPVRREKRELLGAITHVDGTARIQTVNREVNQRYWRLLHEFERLTGIPILLNTSFNNNWEPLVDTVDDAMNCLLTTGLDCVVIDDYIATKRSATPCDLWQLVPERAAHASWRPANETLPDRCCYEDPVGGDPAGMMIPVSRLVFDAVSLIDGVKTVGELMREVGVDVASSVLSAEWRALWERRLLRCRPISIGARA